MILQPSRRPQTTKRLLYPLPHAWASAQKKVYNHGESAEPSAKIINAPSSKSETIIGISHHFFRALRNSQNSVIIDSLPISIPATTVIFPASIWPKPVRVNRSELLSIIGLLGFVDFPR